ncbi:uncharacterized protein LOC111714520, partial [Eurytemora carolleeae]|uniref:uncharacterized protein LOC111714520 n=1 Tax=Eurytemora carolleeae TaxID=1294199 RepID=UPI000C77EE05
MIFIPLYPAGRKEFCVVEGEIMFISCSIDFRCSDVQGSTGVGVYNKLFLRSDRDLSVAKSLMDSCLGDHEWNHLDLDGKCKLLQRSIVEANTASYGGARPKPVRKVIQLRKLRKERQGAENPRNKLSVKRANKNAKNEAWSSEDQEALTAASMLCFDLGGEIRKKELELTIRKSNDLRQRKSKLDKQFWSLARRVEKKKGLLSAINDCDGHLVTDFLQLKEVVITELAKVSKGMKSKVFTSRGQQLLKEVEIKNSSAYEKWMPVIREEFEYEDIVCEQVQIADVQAMINSLKQDRAAGVDGVTSAILKAASPLYFQRLTEVVNESYKIGRVPESILVGKMTLIDKKESSLEVGKK